MRIRWINLPALALLAALPAAAQDAPPAFDTDAFCRAEAADKADPTIAAMICTEMETGSRDQAQLGWSGASPEDRAACVSQAGRSAGGSYLTLLGCLEARAKGAVQP
jgi:hypothetical protein